MTAGCTKSHILCFAQFKTATAGDLGISVDILETHNLLVTGTFSSWQDTFLLQSIEQPFVKTSPPRSEKIEQLSSGQAYNVEASTVVVAAVAIRRDEWQWSHWQRHRQSAAHRASFRGVCAFRVLPLPSSGTRQQPTTRHRPGVLQCAAPLPVARHHAGCDGAWHAGFHSEP
jgi:hypothetical protein